MIRAACLAGLLLLPALAHADGFTPAQRAEIVGIVRQALVADPSILRDAVLALQKDQQTKQAAAQAAGVQANRGAIYDDPADQIAGNPQGSVRLVEFFDVNCPYCRRMLPEMARLLKNRGDIALILKDLPVLGASSTLGARALLAARLQGGYLAMQQALMAEGTKVDGATIRAAAQRAGLDADRLTRDMQTAAVTAHINATLELAKQLGIEGTPALVIGGQLVPGAMTYEELQQATKG